MISPQVNNTIKKRSSSTGTEAGSKKGPEVTLQGGPEASHQHLIRLFSPTSARVLSDSPAFLVMAVTSTSGLQPRMPD